MANREWYPADLVDEACPPARSTPDDFIVSFDDDHGVYQLGYKLGDEDITEEEVDTYNQPLHLGDVVHFMCCDRLDDVEVTFRRNGTHEAHGIIPPEHNWCRLDGDQDSLNDTFQGLVECATGHPKDSFFGMSLFADNQDTEQRIPVQFARWSDRIPHRFIMKDGKPAFEQVSAASVNN